MLESLKLNNFQIHGSLVMDFDPCITTIIGNSDTGKSAIIRALYWLCFNQPGGTEFITHGKSSCSVEAKIDGNTISRYRNKENGYLVNEKKFVALGLGNVPQDVENIVNVSEDNFQKQLDAAFWFQDTPGQISKQINKIVDLQLVDESLSSISSTVKKVTAEAEVSSDRLRTAQNRLESLLWVEKADSRLRDLERLQVNLNDLQARLVLARNKTSKIQELEQLLEEAVDCSSIYNKLQSDCTELERINSERVKCLSFYNKWLELLSNNREPLEINGIEEKIEQLKSCRATKEKCVCLYTEWALLELESKNKQKQLEKTEKELQDRFGDRCPVCGRE